MRESPLRADQHNRYEPVLLAFSITKKDYYSLNDLIEQCNCWAFEIFHEVYLEIEKNTN